MTVGSLPVLFLVSMFTFFFKIWEQKKKKKAGPSPFSPSLSVAPLSYLAERDDRNSRVSVNRAKRWRDGKMESIEGDIYGVQMYKVSF